MDAEEPYRNLEPDDILSVVEQAGYHCDGRILALNSYENRVYQVGIEDEKPVIAKFYRPARWTDESILEEHQFSIVLAEREIPVIAPLIRDDKTLFHISSFRLALYPRVGGRAPELDNPEHLLQLGRTMARLHLMGETEDFKYRPELNVSSYAVDSSNYLLENNFIPDDLTDAYQTLTSDLINRIDSCFKSANPVRYIRIHGDCHLGNILWNNDAPFLVDFDDARMGPAIQDLWMLLSGDRPYMTARLYDLLEGYSEFRQFDPRELHLVEALRTLRMINYAGWIAQRWNDPAFPLAFPWFNTQIYWQDHILSLREQAAMMDEPPLEWDP